MSFSNNCATEQSQCLLPYTSEEIRQVADFARQTGLKLFPVSVSGDGKSPCCKERWISIATSEPEELFKSCMGKAGRFGIPCKSNNLIVVDCDVKDAEIYGIGTEQYPAYCKKHNLLLSPVWQSTPSGGCHYFYKADFSEVIKGQTKITQDGVKPNIDVRSVGAPDSDGN